VTKTKTEFTTPAAKLLVYCLDPLRLPVPLDGTFDRLGGPQQEHHYRHRLSDPAQAPPQLRHVLIVPVSGHWPSSRFSVTLSTLGDSRIRCSDIREKPSSSPPHPAKMKSSPTNIIISLVGMAAEVRRTGRSQLI
jgi:hypothetical protein